MPITPRYIKDHRQRRDSHISTLPPSQQRFLPTTKSYKPNRRISVASPPRNNFPAGVSGPDIGWFVMSALECDYYESHFLLPSIRQIEDLKTVFINVLASLKPNRPMVKTVTIINSGIGVWPLLFAKSNMPDLNIYAWENNKVAYSIMMDNIANATVIGNDPKFPTEIITTRKRDLRSFITEEKYQSEVVFIDEFTIQHVYNSQLKNPPRAELPKICDGVSLGRVVSHLLTTGRAKVVILRTDANISTQQLETDIEHLCKPSPRFVHYTFYEDKKYHRVDYGLTIIKLPDDALKRVLPVPWFKPTPSTPDHKMESSGIQGKPQASPMTRNPSSNNLSLMRETVDTARYSRFTVTTSELPDMDSDSGSDSESDSEPDLGFER